MLLTGQLGGSGSGHRLTVKPLSPFSTFRQKDLVQKDGAICDICEQVVKQLVAWIDSNKTEVHILWGAWPSSGAGVGVLSLMGLVQSGELFGSLQRNPGRDVLCFGLWCEETVAIKIGDGTVVSLCWGCGDSSLPFSTPTTYTGLCFLLLPSSVWWGVD